MGKVKRVYDYNVLHQSMPFSPQKSIFSKRVNDLVSFALFFGFGGITYEQ